MEKKENLGGSESMRWAHLEGISRGKVPKWKNLFSGVYGRGGRQGARARTVEKGEKNLGRGGMVYRRLEILEAREDHLRIGLR